MCYLENMYLMQNFDSSMLSLKEIVLWHLGAIAILNLLVWLIPANVGRIEYAEEDEER